MSIWIFDIIFYMNMQISYHKIMIIPFEKWICLWIIEKAEISQIWKPFLEEKKIYYCFLIMGQHIQQMDWQKLYSLLVNIIQCKNSSFEAAFVLDLTFVQVCNLRPTSVPNSQSWWILCNSVIKKWKPKIKNMKLKYPYRRRRAARTLFCYWWNRNWCSHWKLDLCKVFVRSKFT